MITILVLFCILLIFAFIVAVISGIISVSPIILLIIALPAIDYLVFKKIFCRKKK